MNIQIRSYQTTDAAKAAEVWNQVVEDGLAFPQEEYERIGFTKLGVIPGGFRMPDGHYEDIIPHYYVL